MPPHSANDLTHRLVPSPAGRLHVVEQGTGPLVPLVHGFPESRSSWRRQLPAPGERTAVVVGHGRGAALAANSAPTRPDVFRAVGLLGVPYAPRGGPEPSTVFASMGGDDEFYVSYFQEPGRAEAETEPDVRGRLAGFYAALSADTMPAPGAPDPTSSVRAEARAAASRPTGCPAG
ncbi:hypothetical protein SUDANB176_00553 [Streptomyces sp. enrichment culture]